MTCVLSTSRHWGRIYNISYDFSQDYLKFIVRSTYDSDLQHTKISRGIIVSQLTNTISDGLTILQVNHIFKKPCVLCQMFSKLDVRRRPKSIVTLALS